MKFFSAVLLVSAFAFVSPAAFAGQHVTSMGGSALATVGVTSNAGTVGISGIANIANGGNAFASAPVAYKGSVNAGGGAAEADVGVKAKNKGVVSIPSVTNGASGGFGSGYLF